MRGCGTDREVSVRLAQEGNGGGERNECMLSYNRVHRHMYEHREYFPKKTRGRLFATKPRVGVSTYTHNSHKTLKQYISPSIYGTPLPPSPRCPTWRWGLSLLPAAAAAAAVHGLHDAGTLTHGMMMDAIFTLVRGGMHGVGVVLLAAAVRHSPGGRLPGPEGKGRGLREQGAVLRHCGGGEPWR